MKGRKRQWQEVGSVEGLYSSIRVHGVPGFCPFVGTESPIHSPASESVSPLGPKGGGGQHTLAGEGVGKPILPIGQKAWHSVYSVVGNEVEGDSRMKRENNL